MPAAKTQLKVEPKTKRGKSTDAIIEKSLDLLVPFMSAPDPACSVRPNCFIIYILLFYAVCFSMLAFFYTCFLTFSCLSVFLISCRFLRFLFQYSIQLVKYVKINYCKRTSLRIT